MTRLDKTFKAFLEHEKRFAIWHDHNKATDEREVTKSVVWGTWLQIQKTALDDIESWPPLKTRSITSPVPD